MTHSLKTGTNLRRIILFAAIPAALGLSLALSTSAQTKWTITVNVASGNERPVYKVKPDDVPDCNGNQPPNAENLAVCPGDEVDWQLITNASPNEGTVYFHPFPDQQGNTDQWLHSNGGKIVLKVATNAKVGTYEYAIGVRDNGGHKPYHVFVHDPKIMIGTGLENNLLREMEKEVDKMDEICRPPLKSESKADPQLETLCRDVEDLKKRLLQAH